MMVAKALHLLVTGPDFEVRSEDKAAGLPLIGDLLLSMGPPFGLDALRLEPNPLPGGLPYLAGDSGTRAQALRYCADHGQFDQYWNLLLEDQLSKPSAEANKPLLLERELSMRESFYRAVQVFDKGHLAQTTLAAQLDWSTWITSSFARFADRAVDLFAQNQPEHRWRTIGDPTSAELLARRLFFEDRLLDRHRYLFRLRGDSANITSLAIAGFDREIFSRLPSKVNDVYLIYNAAKLFIQSYTADPGTSVFWHVVGEPTIDWQVLRILAESLRDLGARTIFVVASQSPSHAASQIRTSISNMISSTPLDAMIWEQAELPFKYMCRVKDLGLPASTESNRMREWLDSKIDLDSSQLRQQASGQARSFVTTNESRSDFQSCFLSHSSMDKIFCDRLYQDLEGRGVRCWYFPESAVMGRSVWEEIDQNIRNYDRLIVVLSANSLKSGPVLREILRGLNQEDRTQGNVIFPIRIDNFVFESWESPRRADVLSKIIGDFSDWEKNESKYQSSFGNLLRGLRAEE